MTASPMSRATAAADVGLLVPGRPESLTDTVYDAIRDGIMRRVLAPGERVTEAALAATLNVSKTPVREALLKLRTIGLIEEDGRRAWRVVRPSPAVIRHAYEMREALEVFAARSAALTGDAERAATIDEAARRSLEGARAGSHDDFRTWDFAFHRGVARALGNPMLSESLEHTFALIVTLRERDLPHIHFHVQCAEAHVRVAGAIARGDSEAAEQEMRAHVHQVRDYVLESFARHAVPDAGT